MKSPIQPNQIQSKETEQFELSKQHERTSTENLTEHLSEQKLKHKMISEDFILSRNTYILENFIKQNINTISVIVR